MGFQRITLAGSGTTIQTKWPEQAFRAFLNVDLGADGRGVPSKSVRCPHCRNTGFVILDHTLSDAVACPMCVIGRMHNKSWRMGPIQFDSSGKPVVNELPIHDWCWRPSDDIAQHSWNYGLSVDHVAICGECNAAAAVPRKSCVACQRKREGAAA